MCSDTLLQNTKKKKIMAVAMWLQGNWLPSRVLPNIEKTLCFALLSDEWKESNPFLNTWNKGTDKR